MNKLKHGQSWSACALTVLAISTIAAAPLRAQTPASTPPLPAETSDVATLPPAGPHRLFVGSGFGAGSGTNVIDADSPMLSTIGQVPMNSEGLAAVSRDAGRIFVLETFYSRGNRGTREDVLAVYDGQTLKLLKEIVVPGRLHVVPRRQVFEVSADARLAYVYDMVPASGVHVVDIEAGKVLTTVNLPGCALIFPYGPRSFGSLCGDGTAAVVEVPTAGEAKAVFSKPFFQPTADPIFETSVVDKDTGEVWFLTYSGMFLPARLTDKPVIGKPWSISVAAGLPQAGTGVQELAWRPGGAGQVMALHRATKRLFVLMHTGNFWTHKAPGTEVWVFDAPQQKLIRRFALEGPASGIAVSQGENPLLYVVGTEGGGLAVLDATSGEELRRRKMSANLTWVPGE